MRSNLTGILLLAALLCLSGCILTESRVDPQTGEVIASPLSQAVNGAVSGGISGGPAGGVIGGIGGLIAGLGAALAARKGHQKRIGQVVSGVGAFIKSAPIDQYSDLGAADIVAAERERLLAVLSSSMDEATKAAIRQAKRSVGMPEREIR